MVNYVIGPYVVPRATYDPITIKLNKLIHIHIKHTHIEFHRRNKIFKPIIIAKHIILRGPVLDLRAIMDRPYQNFLILLRFTKFTFVPNFIRIPLFLTIYKQKLEFLKGTLYGD